jgi:hypothetical protein
MNKYQIFVIAMLASTCLSQEIPHETECHECLDFTHKISSLTNGGKTYKMTDIREEYVSYCNNLGNKLACLNFNDLYLPATVTMLSAELGDYHICTYLGDCPIHVPDEPSYELGDKCDMCQSVVEIAEDFAEHKLPESKVQEYVDSWCEYTHKYESKCEMIVNATLPLVYQYIEQHATSQMICQLAHFC